MFFHTNKECLDSRHLLFPMEINFLFSESLQCFQIIQLHTCQTRHKINLFYRVKFLKISQVIVVVLLSYI